MFNPDRAWFHDPENGSESTQEVVAPPFKSRAHAAFFIAVVLGSLFLPLLIGGTGLITRPDSYDIMPENQGAYSYMRHEIFDETGDIDILFVGSSIIWNAVDTPAVQKALSEKLGRPARVMSFGFNFNGTDIPYTILRDALERRRVRLVIFSIPRLPFTEGPSTTSYRFLQYGDESNVVEELSFGSRVSLYACNVLRSPHDLLTLIRANRSLPSPYAENLGANKEVMGMYREPRTFERFTPVSPIVPAEQMIYSSNTADRFQFTNEELTPHQDLYLNKIIELLRSNKVPLAMLSVPQYSERFSEKIIERQNWSTRFGTDVPIVGISSKDLFAGLDAKEVEKLHCDREHFNKNGNEYFTRTILPALLEVYDTHASKDF